MLVVCLVISTLVDVIFVDAPNLERSNTVSTQIWDHSVVVGLNCEVKVSILLRNYDCEIVFIPRSSILYIIPVVRVSFGVSVVSDLEFIEAT